MVGTNEPYTEVLPPPGQARGVQIDIDGRNLGSRYPTEINLAGDPTETPRALLPRLGQRDRSAWRRRVEEAVGDWWRIAERRAQTRAPGAPPAPVPRRSMAGHLFRW